MISLKMDWRLNIHVDFSPLRYLIAIVLRQIKQVRSFELPIHVLLHRPAHLSTLSERIMGDSSQLFMQIRRTRES